MISFFRILFVLPVVVLLFSANCSCERTTADDEARLLTTRMKDLGSHSSQKIGARRSYRGATRHRADHLSPYRGLKGKKSDGQDCTPVSDGGQLKSAINDAAAVTPNKMTEKPQVIRICPGKITIAEVLRLDLPNPIQVRCSEPKECIIIPASGYSDSFIHLVRGNLSFEGVIASDFVRSVFALLDEETELPDIEGERINKSLTLKNSEFRHNSNIEDLEGEDDLIGGGSVIFGSRSTVNILSCKFESNVARYGGAAISLIEGSLTVIGSVFELNEVEPTPYSLGGAIALVNVNAMLKKTSFLSNGVVDASGGAVTAAFGGDVTTQGSLSIISCTFVGNIALAGGAIFQRGGILTVADTHFESNNQMSLKGVGGAIYLFNVNAMFTRTSFLSNNAVRSAGGAIVAVNRELDGSLSIVSCTFRDNLGGLAGGAIAQNGGILSVADSHFEQNHQVANEGLLGGGAITLIAGNATISKTSFKMNSALKSGGAIYAGSNSFLEVKKGCTFANNHAGNSGGAIYVDIDSSILLSKSKFKRNTASSSTQCDNILQYQNDVLKCGP